MEKQNCAQSSPENKESSLSSGSDLETSLLKRLAAQNQQRTVMFGEQSPENLSKLIHYEFDLNDDFEDVSPNKQDSDASPNQMGGDIDLNQVGKVDLQGLAGEFNLEDIEMENGEDPLDGGVPFDNFDEADLQEEGEIDNEGEAVDELAKLQEMMDLEIGLNQEEDQNGKIDDFKKGGRNNLAGFSLADNEDLGDFVENQHQQSDLDHKSDKFNKQFKMAGSRFLKDALLQDSESLGDERLGDLFDRRPSDLVTPANESNELTEPQSQLKVDSSRNSRNSSGRRVGSRAIRKLSCDSQGQGPNFEQNCHQIGEQSFEESNKQILDQDDYESQNRLSRFDHHESQDAHLQASSQKSSQTNQEFQIEVQSESVELKKAKVETESETQNDNQIDAEIEGENLGSEEVDSSAVLDRYEREIDELIQADASEGQQQSQNKTVSVTTKSSAIEVTTSELQKTDIEGTNEYPDKDNENSKNIGQSLIISSNLAEAAVQGETASVQDALAALKATVSSFGAQNMSINVKEIQNLNENSTKDLKDSQMSEDKEIEQKLAEKQIQRKIYDDFDEQIPNGQFVDKTNQELPDSNQMVSLGDDDTTPRDQQNKKNQTNSSRPMKLNDLLSGKNSSFKSGQQESKESQRSVPNIQQEEIIQAQECKDHNTLEVRPIPEDLAVIESKNQLENKLTNALPSSSSGLFPTSEQVTRTIEEPSYREHKREENLAGSQEMTIERQNSVEMALSQNIEINEQIDQNQMAKLAQKDKIQDDNTERAEEDVGDQQSAGLIFNQNIEFGFEDKFQDEFAKVVSEESPYKDADIDSQKDKGNSNLSNEETTHFSRPLIKNGHHQTSNNDDLKDVVNSENSHKDASFYEHLRMTDQSCLSQNGVSKVDLKRQIDSRLSLVRRNAEKLRQQRQVQQFRKASREVLQVHNSTTANPTPGQQQESSIQQQKYQRQGRTASLKNVQSKVQSFNLNYRKPKFLKRNNAPPPLPLPKDKKLIKQKRNVPKSIMKQNHIDKENNQKMANQLTSEEKIRKPKIPTVKPLCTIGASDQQFMQTPKNPNQFLLRHNSSNLMCAIPEMKGILGKLVEKQKLSSSLKKRRIEKITPNNANRVKSGFNQSQSLAMLLKRKSSPQRIFDKSGAKMQVLQGGGSQSCSGKRPPILLKNSSRTHNENNGHRNQPSMASLFTKSSKPPTGQNSKLSVAEVRKMTLLENQEQVLKVQLQKLNGKLDAVRRDTAQSQERSLERKIKKQNLVSSSSCQNYNNSNAMNQIFETKVGCKSGGNSRSPSSKSARKTPKSDTRSQKSTKSGTNQQRRIRNQGSVKAAISKYKLKRQEISCSQLPSEDMNQLILGQNVCKQDSNITNSYAASRANNQQQKNKDFENYTSQPFKMQKSVNTQKLEEKIVKPILKNKGNNSQVKPVFESPKSSYKSKSSKIQASSISKSDQVLVPNTEQTRQLQENHQKSSSSLKSLTHVSNCDQKDPSAFKRENSAQKQLQSLQEATRIGSTLNVTCLEVEKKSESQNRTSAFSWYSIPAGASRQQTKLEVRSLHGTSLEDSKNSLRTKKKSLGVQLEEDVRQKQREAQQIVNKRMGYGCPDLNKTDDSLEATFRPEQNSNYRSYQEQNLTKNDFKRLMKADRSDKTLEKELRPIIKGAGRISRSPSRDNYEQSLANTTTASGWFKSNTFIQLQQQKFSGEQFNTHSVPKRQYAQHIQNKVNSRSVQRKSISPTDYGMKPNKVSLRSKNNQRKAAISHRQPGGRQVEQIYGEELKENLKSSNRVNNSELKQKTIAQLQEPVAWEDSKSQLKAKLAKICGVQSIDDNLDSDRLTRDLQILLNRNEEKSQITINDFGTDQGISTFHKDHLYVANRQQSRQNEDLNNIQTNSSHESQPVHSTSTAVNLQKNPLPSLARQEPKFRTLANQSLKNDNKPEFRVSAKRENRKPGSILSKPNSSRSSQQQRARSQSGAIGTKKVVFDKKCHGSTHRSLISQSTSLDPIQRREQERKKEFDKSLQKEVLAIKDIIAYKGEATQKVQIFDQTVDNVTQKKSERSLSPIVLSSDQAMQQIMQQIAELEPLLNEKREANLKAKDQISELLGFREQISELEKSNS